LNNDIKIVESLHTTNAKTEPLTVKSLQYEGAGYTPLLPKTQSLIVKSLMYGSAVYTPLSPRPVHSMSSPFCMVVPVTHHYYRDLDTHHQVPSVWECRLHTTCSLHSVEGPLGLSAEQEWWVQKVKVYKHGIDTIFSN